MIKYNMIKGESFINNTLRGTKTHTKRANSHMLAHAHTDISIYRDARSRVGTLGTHVDRYTSHRYTRYTYTHVRAYAFTHPMKRALSRKL